jgi:hypothetical protein
MLKVVLNAQNTNTIRFVSVWLVRVIGGLCEKYIVLKKHKKYSSQVYAGLDFVYGV